MNLFAYGTLMSPEGFRPALGDRAFTLRFRMARLPGWRRVWNAYREEWGGGVLNMEPAAGAAGVGVGVIVGVVISGLTGDDFARMDAQEATHLPRETVFVEPLDGEPVPAQVYWRRRGNHRGKPAPGYLAVVLERSRQAGPEVFENLRTGSVDASGLPLDLA
jgi:hypothetical protein